MTRFYDWEGDAMCGTCVAFTFGGTRLAMRCAGDPERVLAAVATSTDLEMPTRLTEGEHDCVSCGESIDLGECDR